MAKAKKKTSATKRAKKTRKKPGAKTGEEKKLERLQKILRRLGSVAIAYSGGVDSTFLVKVACDTLGRDNVLAVTASSETYVPRELADAKRLAKRIGARHVVITTSELDIAQFKDNPPTRCYWCKRELFGRLREVAAGCGIKHLCDGANADDPHEWRPGLKAAKELGVKSPLREADLGKDDIRRLSRAMDLPTWNKPAMACLSSRFPYGQSIVIEKIRQVAEGEEYLRRKGLVGIRVRHHGDTARIEVPPGEIARLAEPAFRRGLVRKFKSLGFTYVALDLEGYRSGSMDEVLPGRKKRTRRS